MARTDGPVGEFSNCRFVVDGAETKLVAREFIMGHGTNNTTVISGGARMDGYLKMGCAAATIGNTFILTGAGTVHSNLHVASSYDPTEYKLFTNAETLSNRFVVADGARLERVQFLAAAGGRGNEIVFSNTVCTVPSVAITGGSEQHLVFDRVAAAMTNGFPVLQSTVNSRVDIRDSYMTNNVAGPSVSVGHTADSLNNAFHFSHSQLLYGPYQYLGFNGTNNAVFIENGSTWKWSGGNGSGDCYVGWRSTAVSNSVTISDSEVEVNNFYGGYQGFHSRIRVEKQGILRARKSMVCGYGSAPYDKGGSNRWEIVDGGLVTNGTHGVIFYGAGQELAVSNGTLASQGALAFPYDDESSSGLAITIAGTNSLIATSAYSHNALRFQRDTTLRFIVPREGYVRAPIQTTDATVGDITFGDDVTYRFDFTEFLKGTVTSFDLVRINGGTIVLSQTAFERLKEAVTSDSNGNCRLIRESKVLRLKRKSGLIISIR